MIMNENCFSYRTHCELIILSDEFSPAYISEGLGIDPSRSFKKGDETISNKSGSIVRKPYNLWALSSNPTDLREETISHHINHLKSTFSLKIDALMKYKENPSFEVSLWVWIETDNVGIGLDLNNTDLDFINCVTNRVHVSFLSNKEINID